MCKALKTIYASVSPLRHHFLWPVYFFLLCVVLSISVHCLPTGAIVRHVENSHAVFKEEGEYPAKSGITHDNFTDAIILLISSYTDSSSAIKKAFVNNWNTLNPKTTTLDTRPADSLLYPQLPHYPLSYSRYWHGYQVLTRPLLSFFDYQTIRQLNCAFQLFCFGLVIYLMFRHKLKPLIPVWTVFYLLLAPIPLWNTIAHSLMFFVTSLATALLIAIPKKIERNVGYFFFFMMLGICTSWLDFLTYPVITLILPLCILLYLLDEKDLKSNIKDLILLCLAWSIGYAGMWSMKWILGSFVTGQNIFADAWNSIQEKTHSEVWGREHNRFLAIKNNFEIYYNLPFFRNILGAAFMGYVVAAGIMFYRVGISFKPYLCRVLPFLLLACSAPVWYLMIANHSIEHSWFTFRTGTATFVPLLTALACIFKYPQAKIKNT